MKHGKKNLKHCNDKMILQEKIRAPGCGNSLFQVA